MSFFLIVIIDYGLGNLSSIAKAFKEIGQEVYVSKDPQKISDADALVLPGMGTFAEGMQNLHSYGLIDVLNHEVTVKKKPILGICLGMQLLATKGLEFGEYDGLNFIPGSVVLMNVKGERLPHVGWNDITYSDDCSFFDGLDSLDKSFYFSHSYCFKPDSEDVVASRTHYGLEFVSAVCKDNIFATQYHPEKSQKNGLKLLKNFVHIYNLGNR